jgi:ATP-dependent helicase HrpB
MAIAGSAAPVSPALLALEPRCDDEKTQNSQNTQSLDFFCGFCGFCVDRGSGERIVPTYVASGFSRTMRLPLPIDLYIDQILDHVRRARAVVVTAAPGAGKTTRVPPALMADGPVILLQPRRVAARAIAARIANERGWTLGREVGWQVRFDRRLSDATRLLVVTEGILTARLQTDPLLSDFRTVVLDEFHERSVHADLAIALARQAWHARDQLRIVVMSATLDAAPVSAFLGGCPVVDVPGLVHPVDVSYTPAQSVANAAADVVKETEGQVLCFLPGAGEIRRAVEEMQHALPGVDVVPLHGSLDAGAQDLALQPSPRRRVIVATNIAETSLTVPGVTAVIDSGLHKVARYDADRGIDSLETERITADAAAQRAGRAGRLAPGLVRRLWDARDRLRPHREPEIHRIDLSSTILDVIGWGGDPRTLEWFDRPREEALEAALTLLARLGLVDSPGRLTSLGEQVRRLPLHPRLGRMLVAANGARSMVRACALLSERHLLPPRTASTASDLLSAIDSWHTVPPHVQRVANDVARGFEARERGLENLSETQFLRAVLSGYPDRVAQRRQPGSPDVLLASGIGATVAPESGVRGGDFVIALDVSRPPARKPGPLDPANVARIRMASRIEREWLTPTASEVVHRFDKQSGTVKAALLERYDELVLAERPMAVDPEIAAGLLAEAWLARGPRDEDGRLLRRLRFAAQSVELDALVRAAAYGARSLDQVELARALPPEALRAIDRDAPETLAVPSGRHHRLEYSDDGTVAASVKLQELFGLAETPRIGPRREPVVLSLLAPNGRPVQVTRDLRSFWNRTYPEVRRELRGRYPKHPWPEDPWRASPTSKSKPKS